MHYHDIDKTANYKSTVRGIVCYELNMLIPIYIWHTMLLYDALTYNKINF
jgi:hypothetical protein